MWQLYALRIFGLTFPTIISAFQAVGLSSTDLIINSATIFINCSLALALVMFVRGLDRGLTRLCRTMAGQSGDLAIGEEEIDDIGRDNVRAFAVKYAIHVSMVCVSPVACYHVIKAMGPGEEHLGPRVFGTGKRVLVAQG